jgi:CBS-domain-containing membrane protein
LQYGLTAAPASQPRNVIVGQTFALVIAQGIGQAENIDPWLKQSLATALAISVMVKLGVTHPPAGAGALLFSTGGFTWVQVSIMLMANVVAVICAAFFNNLSDRRQYPTFWGLGFLHRLVFNGDDAEKKKKET